MSGAKEAVPPLVAGGNLNSGKKKQKKTFIPISAIVPVEGLGYPSHLRVVCFKNLTRNKKDYDNLICVADTKAKTLSSVSEDKWVTLTGIVLSKFDLTRFRQVPPCQAASLFMQSPFCGITVPDPARFIQESPFYRAEVMAGNPLLFRVLHDSEVAKNGLTPRLLSKVAELSYHTSGTWEEVPFVSTMHAPWSAAANNPGRSFEEILAFGALSLVTTYLKEMTFNAKLHELKGKGSALEHATFVIIDPEHIYGSFFDPALDPDGMSLLSAPNIKKFNELTILGTVPPEALVATYKVDKSHVLAEEFDLASTHLLAEVAAKFQEVCARSPETKTRRRIENWERSSWLALMATVKATQTGDQQDRTAVKQKGAAAAEAGLLVAEEVKAASAHVVKARAAEAQDAAQALEAAKAALASAEATHELAKKKAELAQRAHDELLAEEGN